MLFTLFKTLNDGIYNNIWAFKTIHCVTSHDKTSNLSIQTLNTVSNVQKDHVEKKRTEVMITKNREKGDDFCQQSKE